MSTHDHVTTLRRPPAPTVVAVHSRIAPPLDPGEPLRSGSPATDGALALDPAQPRVAVPVQRGLPAAEPADRHLVAVATTDATLSEAGERREVGPTAADEGRDRELRAWAARLAQAAVEVSSGDRPVAQLLRWTSPRVYAELDRRSRVLGRSQALAQRRTTIRPQVRSVHLCRPADGVAEVSVHLRHGLRSRAVAARLELRNRRWTCTALRIG